MLVGVPLFKKKSVRQKFISRDWLSKCRQWKKDYPIVKKEFYKQKNFVNPYVFVKELSKQLSNKSVVIADDGGHLTWAIQAFKVKKGQKLFSAFGNSPMGYALPASIGASIAKNKSKVINVEKILLKKRLRHFGLDPSGKLFFDKENNFYITSDNDGLYKVYFDKFR